MSRFRILGMTDSPGCCDLCGTFCPARRVAVELIYDDGSRSGDVQYWGVVCAGEAREGRRSAAIARQIRAEAEEAGDYAGRPASGRRGRMPGLPGRLSPRAAARAAAQAAADDRRVWFRTSSAVPATVADNQEAAALYRYRAAGLTPAAAVLVLDDAGQLAAVNGTDAADVQLFAGRGFRPATPAAL